MVGKTSIISYSILVLMIALLVYNYYRPGKYDALAECLEDKGALFYGAYWCPACNQQKTIFGKSVSKLPYIECSMPGSKQLIDACQNVDIKAFPTWIFKDGTRIEGVMPVDELAKKTECKVEN